jgi:hypothetical protein
VAVGGTDVDPRPARVASGRPHDLDAGRLQLGAGGVDVVDLCQSFPISTDADPNWKRGLAGCRRPKTIGPPALREQPGGVADAARSADMLNLTAAWSAGAAAILLLAIPVIIIELPHRKRRW